MSRRGISSERIAKSILKKRGFQILDKNKKVVLNGTQVFEVDLIARDENGESYCVEVKAGKIGVSDIRQSYANSMVLGLKPLIVCKGYADKATEVLAEELNVKVFLFPDYYYLIEPEDLDYIVREAVRDILEEYGLVSLSVFENITRKELKILKAFSATESFDECAKCLDMSIEKLGEYISTMREKGLLRKTEGYAGIKRQAKRILFFVEMVGGIEDIQKNIKNILKKLETKN